MKKALKIKQTLSKIKQKNHPSKRLKVSAKSFGRVAENWSKLGAWVRRRLINPKIQMRVFGLLLQRDLKGELLGIPTRRKTLTDNAVPTREKLSWPIPRTVNDRRYLPTGMANKSGFTSVHFTFTYLYTPESSFIIDSRVVTPIWQCHCSLVQLRSVSP